MFLTSVVLSVCLTIVFAEPFFPNVQANPNFVSQQVPSMTREDQRFSPNMPFSPMEGNQNMYPISQVPVMQGFQPPFPFNPINQQQLSILLMSTYARMISLIQLMNMQNRYQPYNQYSDPAVNNFVQSAVPLPYVQQPQVETQNNLQNELLQQQQQQAEAQHKAILDERKIQREYDMEIQRREELIKRQAEEEEIENKQKEIERQLLDEEEIERQRQEAQQQIFEEEQEEIRRKEEELRLQQIENEKLKEKKLKTRPPTKVIRKSRKSSVN
ncbi:transcription factor SPT20 homolog isoform X2 [Rhopalosiphum padi]|uniref:transcription factor SPT20 homolog isoform X2 n=1 Tax=Rhopalosiphum padi TaxID=40932 RepID=UPI00298E72C8|nr:transcription factor SPT20 homolog isoform X2 [Rhopalosiphum padi]